MPDADDTVVVVFDVLLLFLLLVLFARSCWSKKRKEKKRKTKTVVVPTCDIIFVGKMKRKFFFLSCSASLPRIFCSAFFGYLFHPPEER